MYIHIYIYVYIYIYTRMARTHAQEQRSWGWGDEFSLRLVLVMLGPLKSPLRLGASFGCGFWVRARWVWFWCGAPPAFASLLRWSGCVLPGALRSGDLSALVSLRLVRWGCPVCSACDLHLFRLRSSCCAAHTIHGHHNYGISQ